MTDFGAARGGMLADLSEAAVSLLPLMDQELIPKLFSSQPGKYILFTQATLSHLALLQQEKTGHFEGKHAV